MYSFTICLLILVVGYFVYGRYVERVFGPEAKRPTPALTKADGVDYIPLPTWKIFMIQFLNIAGLGPIFGAIMGAKFGTASYLWIVLGSVLAGATHDYFSGMLSIRHGGESLPEIIGRYLGMTTKQVMRGFTVILMVLVGAVFVAGPAGLLAKLTPDALDTSFWIVVVFLYYILATLLPVDKIIGKIYPIFAIALLFMAVGILVMLYVNHPVLPELWDGLQNTHPNAANLPVFPIMFVSIACGAISGFHATQSPMMARCMKSEKYGRPVFYGAMITEGIVALIWAAAATYFYHENGMAENNASVIVDAITKSWLGSVGGILAILGVIAAPITSGDTAFRSARLIVADFMENAHSARPYGDYSQLFDSKGVLLNETKFERIGNFYNGLAPVILNNKLGIVDSEGNIVIEPSYPSGINPISDMFYLSEDLILMNTQGHIGIIEIIRT